MSATPENTQSTDPVFMLQRCYLKDLSLEQPNVDVQMSVEAQPVVEGLFEITVAATITARMQDRVLFLVEGKQAGIFELRNIPQEHADMLLGIACPQTVYPYLRANLADVITRAGFPPVHLAEINFQAMYEQQQAQQQAANDAPSIITPDRLN